MAYKALECVAPSVIADLGVPSDAAVRLHESLAEIFRDCGDDAPENWQRISAQLLDPELPFSFHQMMYYGCYKDFGPDPPAWLPDPFFWKAILDEMRVSFSMPPQCILRDDQSAKSQLLHPGGLWLPGSYVNLATNCRKRDLIDTMVIWHNEGDDEVTVNKLTLKELHSEVWLVAYALETLELEKGSAIAIDMPMAMYSGDLFGNHCCWLCNGLHCRQFW